MCDGVLSAAGEAVETEATYISLVIAEDGERDNVVATVGECDSLEDRAAGTERGVAVETLSH